MQCPKCQADMETIEHDGVEIDRCTSCHGIWFDAGESHWLRHEEAANAIDTGDPSTGKEHNEIKAYRCPRCDGGMLRHVDLRTKSIHYEECTSCRGMFFDAGEFAQIIRSTQ